MRCEEESSTTVPENVPNASRNQAPVGGAAAIVDHPRKNLANFCRTVFITLLGVDLQVYVCGGVSVIRIGGTAR
jgi:hypothetical protein